MTQLIGNNEDPEPLQAIAFRSLKGYGERDRVGERSGGLENGAAERQRHERVVFRSALVTTNDRHPSTCSRAFV